MTYLIGTDIGTLGAKSIIIDSEGKILSSEFEEYDVLTPNPGWAEQWPEIWFEAVCRTIRSAIKNSQIDNRQIAGLCISGLYGGSGIPCDKDMKPIRPCLIWADRRALKECQQIQDAIGVKDIFNVTGNVIDPYYGYTKMLWMKKNEPKNWDRIHQLVTPNAYCIYRITGNVSVDYSSAGNYGGIFDINKKDWSEKMMSELAIPREFFPEEILMSKDIVGEVNQEGAELTGLRKGTPVSAGGIDAPVSALSTGAFEDGDLSLMLGTSMANGFISHKPRLSSKLINFPYVVRDTEILYSFAGLVTAGYCIRWFRDQFGKMEAIVAKDTGLSAYPLLDAEAEKIPPGADGLIFSPHMMIGERAPYWDSHVRGTLTGLTVYHTRAHIFRSFLEGIAFALRYSVEVAMEVGMPVKRSIMVNGASKSELWRSIMTDVSGLSMLYIARAPGAPLGDALLAGMGSGVFSNHKVIEEWLEITELTKPNLQNKNKYDRYYDLFRNIYESNRGVYERLGEIIR